RFRLSTHSASALQRLFCSGRIGTKTSRRQCESFSTGAHVARSSLRRGGFVHACGTERRSIESGLLHLQDIDLPAYRAPRNRRTAKPQGKAIAVSSPGSSNDQAARLMLKKLGLEAGREVTLLSTGDSQARLLTMESNVAAGSAVNPDVAAHLTLRGY